MATKRAPSPAKATSPSKTRKQWSTLAAKAKKAPSKKAPSKKAPSKNAPSKKAPSKNAPSKKMARTDDRVKPSAEPIAAGERVPDFALTDQRGQIVRRADLHGAPFVLYFYPKDDTPGCTVEACDFRDQSARFDGLGCRVVGVSPDGEQSHARFASKYGLNFTLLADPDKELCRAFGVWQLKKNYGREYLGVVRSTFLVDRTGRIARVWRGVKVNGHAESVLNALGSL